MTAAAYRLVSCSASHSGQAEYLGGQIGLDNRVRAEAATTGRPVLVPDVHHSTEASPWPISASMQWWNSPRWGRCFAVPLQ